MHRRGAVDRRRLASRCGCARALALRLPGPLFHPFPRLAVGARAIPHPCGGPERTLDAAGRRTAEAPVEGAARRLAAGQIGAIYTGRMEYGPRALGARTILANPSRRDTHDLLNERLDRSEFMPFAPVISAERAAEVFDVNPRNAYACRFMTITCEVRP